MAETETIDDAEKLRRLEQWISDNKNEAGSPKFVQATEAAEQLRGQVGGGSRVPVPGGEQGGPSTAIGDAIDLMKRSWSYDDPTSISQTAVRGGANFIAAPLDIAHMAGRYVTGSKIDPTQLPSNVIKGAIGVKEVEDPGVAQQVIDTALPLLFGGGGTAIARGVAGAAPGVLPAAGAATAAATKSMAVPYIASEVGGTVGAAVTGGDERGRFVGSLAGPLAPGVGSNALRRGLQEYYRWKAGENIRPDAAEVTTSMRNLGGEPTYGQLVEPSSGTQWAERGLISTPAVEGARTAAIDRIRAAFEALPQQRAALPPETPANKDYLSVARQQRDIGQPAGPAVEQLLANRIGVNAPTDVLPTATTSARLMRERPTTMEPLDRRLGPMFESLPRDAQGNLTPTITPGGGVELPARYSVVADARSQLGRRIEGAPDLERGAQSALYGPMTDAMREAATRRGVAPEAFDAVHSIYQREKAAEQLSDLQNKVSGEFAPKAPEMRNIAQTLDRLQRSDNFDKIAGTPGQTGDVTQRIDDIRRSAGAMFYPTEQGGMQKTNEQTMSRYINPLTTGAAGAALPMLFPGGTSSLRSLLTGAAGAAVPAVVDMIRNERGRMLESPLVREALLGNMNPMTPRTPTIQELLAALQAAGVVGREQY